MCEDAHSLRGFPSPNPTDNHPPQFLASRSRLFGRTTPKLRKEVAAQREETKHRGAGCVFASREHTTRLRSEMEGQRLRATLRPRVPACLSSRVAWRAAI